MYLNINVFLVDNLYMLTENLLPFPCTYQAIQWNYILNYDIVQYVICEELIWHFGLTLLTYKVESIPDWKWKLFGAAQDFATRKLHLQQLHL